MTKKINYRIYFRADVEEIRKVLGPPDEQGKFKDKTLPPDMQEGSNDFR